MQHNATKHPAPATRLRAFGLVLGTVLALWSWYGHFWPHLYTANESIRLYFIQAVIETGRPEIDDVSVRHGGVPVDRSEYAGHVYMDKAPGLSLLGLPLYPLVHALHPAIAGDDLWLFGLIACWLTVTLPAWLALWLLARYLSALGLQPRLVAISVLALALASPYFAYATLYFGHALAAACVGSAAWLVAETPELSVRRRTAIGALLALAGLVDTPVFALGGLVLLWLALRTLPQSAGWALAHRLRAVAPVLALLVAGVLVQLAFNAWMLGDPLRFAYHWKADPRYAKLHGGGLFGFHLPDFHVLWHLLVGPARGLVYHAPWLAPAVGGLVLAARDQRATPVQRLDAAALLVLAALYTLAVSGFADWRAGDAAYARHLVPVLPLLAPGLAFVLGPASQVRPARAVVLASILVGVLLTLPTIATFPYHFARLERPVLELGWPLWLLGEFSPSIGRALGWSDWTSAAVFVAAAVVPFLLTLRLPGPLVAATEAWRARAAVWAVTLLTTALWGVVLMSTVPHPGRVVQIARAQSSAMLGPDADERDGVKPWQLIYKQARERAQRQRAEQAH